MAESTHALYNGVKLPKISEALLARYPYCWIRNNTTSGYYELIMADTPFHYVYTSETSAGLSLADRLKTQLKYRISIENAEMVTSWELEKVATNTWWGVYADKPVLWSNHDIPNGSADATDIYFKCTEPVPIEEEPEEPTATIEITYNGEVIASLGAGQTATIKCANTELEHDIVVSAKAEEDDSIVGTWVFNDTLTFSPSWKLSQVAATPYARMQHSSYDGSNIHSMKIESGGLAVTTAQGLSAWPYYNGWASGWEHWIEIYDTSIIETYADYENFVTWLKANATKQ